MTGDRPVAYIKNTKEIIMSIGNIIGRLLGRNAVTRPKNGSAERPAARNVAVSTSIGVAGTPPKAQVGRRVSRDPGNSGKPSSGTQVTVNASGLKQSQRKGPSANGSPADTKVGNYGSPSLNVLSSLGSGIRIEIPEEERSRVAQYWLGAKTDGAEPAEVIDHGDKLTIDDVRKEVTTVSEHHTVEIMPTPSLFKPERPLHRMTRAWTTQTTRSLEQEESQAKEITTISIPNKYGTARFLITIDRSTGDVEGSKLSTQSGDDVELIEPMQVDKRDGYLRIVDPDSGKRYYVSLDPENLGTIFYKPARLGTSHRGTVEPSQAAPTIKSAE